MAAGLMMNLESLLERKLKPTKKAFKMREKLCAERNSKCHLYEHTPEKRNTIMAINWAPQKLVKGQSDKSHS